MSKKKYDRIEKDPTYHTKIHNIMNKVLDLEYKSKNNDYAKIKLIGGFKIWTPYLNPLI